MKENNLLISFLFISCLSFFYSSFSYCYEDKRISYCGFDYQLCKTCFNEGYGDNLFKRNAIGGNIYIGERINDNISIDIGYQYLSSLSRINTFQKDEIAIGFKIQDFLEPISFKSSLLLHGPYIAASFNTDINKVYQFFISFGVSRSTAIYKVKIIQFKDMVSEVLIKKQSTNYVPRSSFGINYKINDMLSVKSSILFMYSNKLSYHFNNKKIISPKDFFCYNIGLSFLY